MNKTPFDLGLEAGRAQMRHAMQNPDEPESAKVFAAASERMTLKSVAVALMESRFQTVSKYRMEFLDIMTNEEIRQLILRIPNATSVEDAFCEPK